MYCLSLPGIEHPESLESRTHCSCSAFFDRKRPMKTARWWSAAILLLGLAVLGANGRPNGEGFGSPPYRPVVRFRHKVLIPFAACNKMTLCFCTLFFLQRMTCCFRPRKITGRLIAPHRQPHTKDRRRSF